MLSLTKFPFLFVSSLLTANGVFHSIDKLLMPKELTMSIGDMGKSNSSFSILMELVEHAGLTEALAGGSLTLFAPTNDAFAKFPEGFVEDLKNESNKEWLMDVLTYHAVDGVVLEEDFGEDMPVTMLNNYSTFIVNGSMINQANILDSNVFAMNGYERSFVFVEM